MYYVCLCLCTHVWLRVCIYMLINVKREGKELSFRNKEKLFSLKRK